MLSHLFLAMSLVGAEWVLYLLALVSFISIMLIAERILYYHAALRDIRTFRERLREAISRSNWKDALAAAEARREKQGRGAYPDLETEVVLALLLQQPTSGSKRGADVLDQLARDALVRTRLAWDRNLSVLATIGSNAPFVGLFGTVLGIIKAFHDLSQQAATGVQGVTAGISEALVATAVGILVAIPAVVAYNLLQRRVKNAVSQAEALKSYMIGKLAE